MKRPFAPLFHAGAIVALIVGSNDAAYWTLYTMSKLRTAAEAALRDLLEMPASRDAAGAPSAGFVGALAAPQAASSGGGEPAGGWRKTRAVSQPSPSTANSSAPHSTSVGGASWK
jgi:hypothetical protein